MLACWVALVDVFQCFNFYFRLFVKAIRRIYTNCRFFHGEKFKIPIQNSLWPIFNDFKSDASVLLMIDRFDHFTKRSFPDKTGDFISIGNMIMVSLFEGKTVNFVKRFVQNVRTAL